MTAPKTQIQALINKIDEVLQASNSPRKRSQPQEDVHQQHVLEQTREYLASLQNQSPPFSGGAPNMGESPSLPVIDTSSSSLSRQTGASHVPTFSSGIASPAESAQQVLQAVVQEMNYLRVNMMQPLREELMTLYQQRQMLTADIKRLEQQRYQLMLASQQFNQQKIIEDFLTSLMGRLQEQLATQIAQTYANLELQASQLPSSEQAAEYPQLTPGQRLQHMQQLQSASDEVMLKLDSTLRVVFDSLQTNVDSYQDSLAQGLEKMHGLGQQGEAMFAALVNRFAQQLGRGASYYLQSSMQKEWELPGLGTVEGPDGGLMPRTPVQSEEQVSVPDRVPDDQLNRMIGELSIDGIAGNRSGDVLESNSAFNDELIDELLDVLGAEASEEIGGIDFNLDDIDLAVPPHESADDDSSLDANDVARDEQPADSGDRPSLSQEELTLFEISDDGVRTQIDDERITQIDEADADDFLNELSALSPSDEPSPEHETSLSNEPPQATYSEGHSSQTEALDAIAESTITNADEDDEALAFLDQIATEMEHDLSDVIHAESDVSGQNLVEEWNDRDQSDVSPADIDAESTHGEAVFSSASASEEGEEDAFYQMFDSAPDAPAANNIDNSIEETSTPQSREIASDAAMSEEDTELFGHLFDDLDTPFDASSGISSTEQSSEGTEEATLDTNTDLFSELGITTQTASFDDAQDISGSRVETTETERVETISSLVDLVEDAQARDSLEASIRNTSRGDSTSEPSSYQGADQYIVASPDEDLLVADESSSEQEVPLSLDDDQRQQLASDLAKVEGLDTSDVLTSFDIDFSDAQSQPKNEESPEDTPSTHQPEHEEVEGFVSPDDAFYALSDPPPSSSSQSQSPITLEGFSDEMPISPESDFDIDARQDDIPETHDEETLQGLFDEASEIDNSSAHLEPDTFPGASLPTALSVDEESLATNTVDDLFGEADSMPSANIPSASLEFGAEELSASMHPALTSETETVREMFGNAEQTPGDDSSGSSLDMTVESLFQGVGEPQEDADKGERPNDEIINPFDTDDELRGIFEELQAFDEADTEAAQSQEEKTLMDLMKGFNQPSLPSNEGETFSETDTSWSIFDDVNDSGQDTESGQKKN